MRNTLKDEMYKAMSKGDCEKIDALVASGLDVNTRSDEDEWNFLHMALVSVAIPPNPIVIRHLIGIGVDVNAQDSSLWTPLHYAARTKISVVVKMLVDAGADVNAVNDEGINPLIESLQTQPWNLEVAEILLAAGTKPDDNRSGSTVRRLLDVVASPDTAAMRALLKKYTKK